MELRLGDIMIAISSKEAVEAEACRRRRQAIRWSSWSGCDSADDTVAALRAAGTPVLQEPYSHFSGHRRAYVADPDGNWIVVASK